MKILKDKEEETAIKFIEKSAVLAKQATCLKRKCGSIIVKNGEIIGKGFNSPPRNLKSQRRCTTDKETYNKKITDKTCCIHAEERAIFDALKNNPSKIEGSTLYFTSIDKNKNIEKSGKPYCTICSKRALDSGIKQFVLWHDEGITVYNTEEYNDISFNYKE